MEYRATGAVFGYVTHKSPLSRIIKSTQFSPTAFDRALAASMERDSNSLVVTVVQDPKWTK